MTQSCSPPLASCREGRETTTDMCLDLFPQPLAVTAPSGKTQLAAQGMRLARGPSQGLPCPSGEPAPRVALRGLMSLTAQPGLHSPLSCGEEKGESAGQWESWPEEAITYIAQLIRIRAADRS